MQSLSNTKNSKNKAEKELKQLKENDAKKDEILNKLLSPTGNQTEKDLIKKALQKHRNRRKYAAQELGISERTLYRKIKEYDLGK